MNPFVYIHNRWVCPSDRVIINHHEYQKGAYHDSDYRMLYILFQMVVDFVEIECGSSWGPYHFETFWQKAYRKLYTIPILRWFLPPIRNARRGLHHLRWAMKLTDIPSQAQHARDVFTLYRFWRHERPSRIDPWDVARLCRGDYNLGDPISEEYGAFLVRASKLEDKYNQEDEDMLHLLIKIRMGLWT